MPGLKLNGQFVDLKARKDNKALRDFAAKAVTERDAFRARMEAQHETLEACLVLLCEARGVLFRSLPDNNRLLIGRITELVGDGDAEVLGDGDAESA